MCGTPGGWRGGGVGRAFELLDAVGELADTCLNDLNGGAQKLVAGGAVGGGGVGWGGQGDGQGSVRGVKVDDEVLETTEEERVHVF